MKTRIKNHLSITKKEWNGMVILVVLIVVIIAAPFVYQLFHKDTIINFKEFDKQAAQLDKAGFNKVDPVPTHTADKKTADLVLKVFDPNGLTIAQWQQLGINEHIAGVIKHYEEKGGRFYKKEDLKKIYGVTDEDYTRLEPYISIPKVSSTNKIRSAVIDINTVDSAKFTQLAGIGPSFAERIVRYRNRLGGFYRKDQLMEVYGIDSAKFAEIKGQVTISPNKLRMININTISFDQLRIFPYLNYKQVNAIIEYRKQHGNYSSIDDLKNIVLLDEKTIRKIEPYLRYK